MSLDISTLYALATLVAAMLGALLLYFGRSQKIVALNWWGAAYLLAAATVAIWMVLGNIPGDIVSSVVGASGILASGLIWNAARVFHGQHRTWDAIACGIVLWLVASCVLPESLSGLRMTVGMTIVALFAGLASGQLWSERRRAMQRRWLVVAMPILHGLALLLPVLIGDLLAGDVPLVQSHWAKLFTIELVLYAIGTVFVIFMLISERSVRAHRVAALTDALTGVMNRRGFAEAALPIMARRMTLNQPVSLLVFDIDHFKSVNDRFGHAAGDEILKIFAATLTQTLRTTDLSGRIGGEEFAALLPCSLSDAAIAAERVRHAFATSDVAVDDAQIETTVSIGIADSTAEMDLAGLLVTADAALYRAKANGRNRVEIAASPVRGVDGIEKFGAVRTPQVVRRAPGIRQFPV